jgi:hypothetical protein
MIYHPLSTATRSKEMPLSATAALAQDGQAMVRQQAGLTFGIGPAAGTAGEKFVGFLVAQTSAVPFLQTTAVKVERFVVPAGRVLTLSRTLLASSAFVFDVTAGAAITPDSATGTTVTLTTAGVIGNTVEVTYRHNLTVNEARTMNGDVQPGGYAGLMTRTATVWQAGTIYTDQFETGQNYTTATDIELSAGGLLTSQAGAGNVVVPCTIIQVPTVDFPFLGLEFSAY